MTIGLLLAAFAVAVAPMPDEPGAAGSYPIPATSVHHGHAATWPACSQVTYELNTTDAPAGAAADVREVFAELSDITGLEFIDQGPTTVIPQDGQVGADDDVDIRIAWAAPPGATGDPDRESDLLPGGPERVEGGVDATTVGTTIISTLHRGPRGLFLDRVHQIAAADVVLDATFNRNHPLDWGGRTQLRGFIQHELVHAVGLSHSDADQSVMAPYIEPGDYPRALRTFDREALAALYPTRCG